MSMDIWFGQVKFGTEINCNIFEQHYMQNNTYFILIKREAM
jgi:hypothetical protein